MIFVTFLGSDAIFVAAKRILIIDRYGSLASDKKRVEIKRKGIQLLSFVLSRGIVCGAVVLFDELMLNVQ